MIERVDRLDALSIETGADKLRAFRQRHGDISQAVAAGWCDTPVRTWEGWEALHRRPPACLWVLICSGPQSSDARPDFIAGSDPHSVRR
jgi:hypothetical protein